MSEWFKSHDFLSDYQSIISTPCLDSCPARDTCKTLAFTMGVSGYDFISDYIPINHLNTESGVGSSPAGDTCKTLAFTMGVSGYFFQCSPF